MTARRTDREKAAGLHCARNEKSRVVRQGFNIERESTMEPGITGKQTITVTEALTAKALGSGELPVFATPAMIALMEETAWRSVAPKLSEGEGTVGTRMEVSHVSATPVGMEVTCETKLIGTDRKRLTFEVKAYDASGLIGEGTHERFVIENGRFMDRAEGKRA